MSILGSAAMAAGRIGAAARSAGVQLSSGLAQGLGSSLLQQPIAAAAYSFNARLPGIVVPSLSDLIALHKFNFISRDAFDRYALKHNVGGANSWIWDRVLQLGETYVGIDDRKRWVWRNGYDIDRRRDSYARLGIKSNFDGFDKSVFQWSPRDVRILSALGFFGESAAGDETPRDYGNWIGAAGLTRNDDYSAFRELIQVPPPGELLAMLNREILTETEWDRQIILNGFTDRHVREQMLRSRYYLPGPSDLIRFAVREAWDPTVVRDFGYDLEFPDPFRYFAKLQGMDFDPAWDQRYTTGTGARGWDSLYWRVHWENMSPHLGYLAQQRFRATGGPGNGPRNNRAGVWLPAKTEQLLKIHDYAPGFRTYMAELAYNPLRLSDIRQTVREILSRPDQWSEVVPAWTSDLTGQYAAVPQQQFFEPTAEQVAYAWAVEAHQDRGVTRADALVLARLDVRRALAALGRAKKSNPAQVAVDKAWVRSILSSYQGGILSHSDALASLSAAGAVEPSRQLDIVDYRVSASIARQQASTIRGKVLKGKLSLPKAKQLLLSAGFTVERVDQWLSLWATLLTTDDVAAESIEVRNEFEAGITSAEQAIAALVNLGWTKKDAANLVATWSAP